MSGLDFEFLSILRKPFHPMQTLLKTSYGFTDAFSSYLSRSHTQWQIGLHYHMNPAHLNAHLSFQTQMDWIRANSLDQNPVTWTNGSFAKIFLSEKKDCFVQLGLGYTHRPYAELLPWSILLYCPFKSEKGSTQIGSFGFFQPCFSFHPRMTSAHSLVFKPEITRLSPSIQWKINYWISKTLKINLQWTFDRTAHLDFLLGIEIPWNFNSRISTEHPTPLSTIQTLNVQALVIQVNDRLNLIKINKGSQEGLYRHQVFEIFSLPSSEKATKIARAQIIGVHPDQSILEILEFYQTTWIESGFLAQSVF